VTPLFSALTGAPFFAELERGLRGGGRRHGLSGLVEGSRALVLLLLARQLERPLLLVVPDDTALEAYERDLTALGTLLGAEPSRIVRFPALDADPYDAIAAHPEVVRERVVALDRLSRGALDVLLTPARALLQPLVAPDVWRSWTAVIRRGDDLPPERFMLAALGLGYRRVDIVSGPGEISRRGGIVDVFSPTAEQPARIELFGDSVDSLRVFDTDNQRSTGHLEQVVVAPATENPPTEAALRRLAGRLDDAIRAARGEARTVRELRERLEQLQAESMWPGFEALAGLTSEAPGTLFEHAAELALVVDEPERTEEELLRAARDREATWSASDNRWLPPPRELFGDPARAVAHVRDASLYLEELAGSESGYATRRWMLASRRARRYAGRMAELVADLRASLAAGVRTIAVMRAPGSADRLREILREYDLAIESVGVAGLRAGFELPELGLAVLAERDVFAEERKGPERKSAGRAAFVSDFRDLKRGDWVVHVDHGVARYDGLGRPKGGSLNRDFMVLEFAGGDRLFVPVDRLDLVQKYNGVAGHKPSPDRLGGPGWARLKERVRRSVETMARELLELYARRRAATGHAFGIDTEWQRELEASFPFELTPDQERAWAEIKDDMQSTRPMDRLLVGDVGFGKTEVAVRAAFKAVQDGFQVAILAPTTVLAAQHFHTFGERYAPFPVRVEMVSRFRAPAEIKRVLADAAAGAVDVLIGTHRLLSGDVEFRKLGLLVVDEEQRFGVKHKERLKQLSIGIEVLSMTATPIPRTLQMSLAGVRDLSVIETPPPGRMAIQTYVVPFRTSVLGQAIRQELRRDGQVFVVHNRIETLHALARLLAELVPEARVVTAHGQMPERKLEQVMLDFVEHRADVLLTTTIIENGLDIPRANTIVVNRADRFGLAQLYQLRGRVGRSEQHAYAYMLVPTRASLSEIARKRLRALQEFSELGAGFRLAAADLEIRGAGELLGPRQHGHIAAVGFDLYCQILERAVDELRGDAQEEPVPVSLHLGVDIKIPEHYLPEAGDRLVIYKRLAVAREEADVDRLQAETEDRFGRLPPPGRNLFDMGRLRIRAERAGVKSIDLVDDRLQIRFQERPQAEPSRILALVAREGGSLKPSGMVVLPAPPRGAERIGTVQAWVGALLS
jgi:transcription-repair coupling factor (superfamily II helicase)